jgi:hypothetical protein
MFVYKRRERREYIREKRDEKGERRQKFTIRYWPI